MLARDRQMMRAQAPCRIVGMLRCLLRRGCALALLLALCASAAPSAQSAIAYKLTFAERERKNLQVDVTFTDVPAGPLQLRMSRSSPGRYALHEFAKNVFDVRATDAGGK